MPTPLRFGVYLERTQLPEWQRQCVELLRSSRAAELPVIVHGVKDSERSGSSVKRETAMPTAQQAVSALWRSMELCRNVSADAISDGADRLTCRLKPDSAGDFLLDLADLRRLREYGLDFILHFGSMGKNIGDHATFGIWRFARTEGLLGAYPFLYEICQRQNTVTFSLEVLTPGSMGANTLYAGHLRARGKNSRDVCREMLAQAMKWPMLAAKYVSLNGSLLARPMTPSPVPPPMGAPGKILAQLAYRDACQAVTAKLDALFSLEIWNVGVSRMDVLDLLQGHKLRDVQWLPRHKSAHYIADPFVFEAGPGEIRCLVEDYSYFGKGKISEVIFRPHNCRAKLDLTPVLDLPHHLSYPYLFNDNGATYCLPEAYEGNSSTLYRFDNGGLIPLKEIVRGRRVTDASVFFHEEYYWLFCGMEDDEDQANLYIFYAKKLEGLWHAHPLNPVKTDVRSSRSAGQIIETAGKLYRPAQNCSAAYGYGICINRIDVLTPTCFSETPLVEIGPEALARGCQGVHTLSFKDGVVVIDGKFKSFGLAPLAVFAYKITSRVKRQFGFGQRRNLISIGRR